MQLFLILCCTSAANPARNATTALPLPPIATRLILIDQADAVAQLLLQQGAFREAEPLSRMLFDAVPHVPAAGQARRASAAFDLAFSLAGLGRAGEARPLFQESIDLYRRCSSPPLTRLPDALHALGELLRDEGDLDAAEKLHLEALVLRRAAFGAEDPRTTVSEVYLASVYQEQGRTDAVKILEKAADLLRRTRGDHHADYAWALGRFGMAVAGSTPDRAQTLLRAAIEAERTLPRQKHPNLAADLYALGVVELQFTSPAAAEPFLLEALDIDLARFGPDHLATARTQGALGEALTGLARYGEAEPLLKRSYDTLLQRLPPVGPEVSEAHQRLVDFFETAGRHEEAELYRTHP